MQNNTNLQKLIEKVKTGKSTPDEELALLRFLNSSMKVFLDFMAHRKPKYLGEKIPITGDGRNYP